MMSFKKNMEFKKLCNENILEYKKYFEKQSFKLAPFSMGYKFMWRNYANTEVCEFCNCLIFKEKYDVVTYFSYPISLLDSIEDERKVLDEIEKYCLDNELQLRFNCVPKIRLAFMLERYGRNVEISSDRCWDDYIYLLDDFATYSGKKFNGQRNHTNKFKSNNPNYRFEKITRENLDRVFQFFIRYERTLQEKTFFNDELAKIEFSSTKELMTKFFDFDFEGGLLIVDDEVVAVTVGEVCDDVLYVHIEKALIEYQGAYPTIAQEFAKTFVGSNVRYINREDDSGEKGMRKSKLQYNPIEKIQKYNVFPKTLLENVDTIPLLRGERIVLQKLRAMDYESYFKLATDEMRNKLWGYDYNKDYQKVSNKYSLYDYMISTVDVDFKNKVQIPFFIYNSTDDFLGEVDLHSFDYKGNAEIGVRLFENYEGNGYAKEAVKLVIDYGLFKLGLENVKADCYKENEKSKKMLLSCGFKQYKEDENKYYFYINASM